MNFDAAFELIIGHEGGYVDDPKDPGGETKYGISKRTYPGEDIRNMTLQRAKQLYLRDYWGPAGCDAVPGMIKFSLFDFATNSGPRVAAKQLQKLVGVYPDGAIGPESLAAINLADPRTLSIALNCSRLDFLTDLPGFKDFGKGWVRRVVKNIRLSLEK